MPYLSQRRRRELALPAGIAYRLAWQILTDDQAPVEDTPREGVDPAVRDEVLTLLHRATLEPLEGLSGPELVRAHARMVELRVWALSPWHNTNMAALLVGVHELLRLLTDTGYMRLSPDGAFARGWDMLIGWLQEREGETEALDNQDEAVRAIGRELLARLQSLGLYRDLIVLEAAA